MVFNNRYGSSGTHAVENDRRLFATGEARSALTRITIRTRHIVMEENSCETDKDKDRERTVTVFAQSVNKESPIVVEFLVRKRSAPRVAPKCSGWARTTISF